MNGTMNTTTQANGKTAVPLTAPPSQQPPPHETAPPPPGLKREVASDPWIYRMVVGFLGLTAIITVVGLLVLEWHSTGTIPEGLIALGSATVGGLAGFLAPSPMSAN
jgi:hypothetical protein